MKSTFRNAGSPVSRFYVKPCIVLTGLSALGALPGCAATSPPPKITYDDAAPATVTPEPPAPITAARAAS